MGERFWLSLDGTKHAVTRDGEWYYTSVNLHQVDEVRDWESGDELRVADREPADHGTHDWRYRLEAPERG